MKRRLRGGPNARDRLIWQCASLLLSYPDEAGLGAADELLTHLDGDAAALLRRTATALSAADPMHAASVYVDTFDLRRRTTMYLTYWTAGDTRERGNAMLRFATAYREANMVSPRGEAPDFLPVVLEFAATVAPDAGRELLAAHRVSIDLLRDALTEIGSPYAFAVAAVCETLPAPTDRDTQRSQHLARTGPPAETVGLQPFTLTVPPRRAQGSR